MRLPSCGGTSRSINPLEIGAFRDREALEVAAQAVEAELDRTQAHPVATAIDARAARFDALLRGDREMDAAAEIDAVGAVMDPSSESACDARVSRRPPPRSAAGADSVLDPGATERFSAISIGCRSTAHNIADQCNAVFRSQSKNDAP